jgi:uncharacterized protein with ParB-like and HNH nuclease domain/predicted transport protein
MKAKDTSLLTFMRNATQSIIPIYQRTYSWQLEQCAQLWADTLHAGASAEGHIHFIGSIVYIERDQSQVSNASPLMVIDGQQRLTTVAILLEALARHMGDGEPVEGFSAKKIRGYYLLNDLESEDRRFKLLLTQTDRDSLIALLSQAPEPREASVRVQQNFEFFTQQLAALNGDVAQVCRGLNKLMIVDVALTRGQDNPQLIFESLNSTGKELSQADLIRNYVLMGLEPGLQKRLYEQYWRPMELDFGQVAYNDHFDDFMRHYLTVRTGEIPRQGEVYAAFKDWSRKPAAGDTEALLKDVRAFAHHYCVIALGATADKDLMRALHDLRELRVDVSYPFLLELFHDHSECRLSLEELIAAIRLVETYVFRRVVCMIPTNSLNKTFARFTASVNKEKYLESIQAQFLLLPSYRRFPGDAEFEREIQRRDLYHMRSKSYWLRRLENHGRKEPFQIESLTIEHVLPQNENLSAAWRSMLGADWERVQGTYLHTLGNLTLTGYNPELSDRPFMEKRDMDGGFKDSPIRMNQELGRLETWNEEAIQARAAKLAAKAVQVWPAPALNAAVVESYRPKKTGAQYTLSDHPHLANPQLRDLFDALSKEVLALDPCVVMEVLKLYIAFKAETNFVDVIPRAKDLTLTLNIAFGEIEDPEKRCEDVTDLGRWGNGDVRVVLGKKEDLPYVMGLVRQSLERQLDVPA